MPYVIDYFPSLLLVELVPRADLVDLRLAEVLQLGRHLRVVRCHALLRLVRRVVIDPLVLLDGELPHRAWHGGRPRVSAGSASRPAGCAGWGGGGRTGPVVW